MILVYIILWIVFDSGWLYFPSFMLILVFQFLSHDIPLFQGIISDLFPGVDLPEADYGHLEEALIEHITKRKLQPSRWFIEKIIQVKQRAMVH